MWFWEIWVGMLPPRVPARSWCLLTRVSFVNEGTHFWLTSRDSKVFGVWKLGFALASSAISTSARTELAGSPVMRVHPSGTDWRQERRPQHLQTSSHCMYGYNIVSKITIRPHFFWKGKVHDYVLLSLKYKYCGRRVATVSDFANLTLKNIKFLIIW